MTGAVWQLVLALTNVSVHLNPLACYAIGCFGYEEKDTF